MRRKFYFIPQLNILPKKSDFEFCKTVIEIKQDNIVLPDCK